MEQATQADLQGRLTEGLPTVRQATVQAAADVKREQDRILAELRRRTTMSDEELYELLKPLAQVAFESGHEIGWTEAMWKCEGVRLRGRAAWIIAFCTSAAAAAGWLMLLP